MAFREKVAKEIVSTEVTYCNSIRTIVNVIDKKLEIQNIN